MKPKSRLPERHASVLSRLCDLAYEARAYSAEQTDQARMRRLATLAETALKYSAAVRTIARAK